MANDVVNVFRIDCDSIAVPLIEAEITGLVAELRAGTKFGVDAQWQPQNWQTLRFVSPWAPDFDMQDNLTKRLCAVHPSVVVWNFYCEEFLQAVGVRLSTLSSGQVDSVTEDAAIVLADIVGWDNEATENEWNYEAIERAVGALQAKCADKAVATWAARQSIPVAGVDLDPYYVVALGLHNY